MEYLITSGLLLEECDEALYEMASIYPRVRTPKIKLCVAVNPSEDRIGNCYFKVYDSSLYGKSRHVIRLNFFKPEALYHRKSTKLPWSDITKSDLRDLNDYLDEESANYPGFTIWDALKYSWNIEKGFDIGTIWDYSNGNSDNEFVDDPDYIPSVLEPCDYSTVDLDSWRKLSKN